MGGFIKDHMILTIVGAVVLVMAVLAVTISQTKKVSPVSWGWFGAVNTTGGIALNGYDSVAYHISSDAIEGQTDYAYSWKDATWLFASPENLDLFVNNPERYAPQSGGFCSFAISKGFTAQSDPQSWHIADGKLYIFADNNFRDQWVGEIDNDVLAKTANNWDVRKASKR